MVEIKDSVIHATTELYLKKSLLQLKLALAGQGFSEHECQKFLATTELYLKTDRTT